MKEEKREGSFGSSVVLADVGGDAGEGEVGGGVGWRKAVRASVGRRR